MISVESIDPTEVNVVPPMRRAIEHNNYSIRVRHVIEKKEKRKKRICILDIILVIDLLHDVKTLSLINDCRA